MALIGEKQCGDMLSVPVENSTLNLKQQAPKPGPATILPHGSAGLLDQGLRWKNCPGGNDKESYRGKVRKRERERYKSFLEHRVQ